MVERFNRRHAIGSSVRVWKGVMGDGPGIVGQVRDPGAYVLSGHTPVVHVTRRVRLRRPDAREEGVKRRSTQPDRDRAIAMRERGRSVAAIARDLGWSKGAVDWWLLQAGAEPPGPPRSPIPRREQPFSRGGHTIRPYTVAEDQFLLRLEAQGLGLTAIARRLTEAHPTRPRTHNSVKGRLMTLARQDERRLAFQLDTAPSSTPSSRQRAA